LPVIINNKIPVPKIAAISAYTKTAKASFIGMRVIVLPFYARK
jgi:hypothetical protein